MTEPGVLSRRTLIGLIAAGLIGFVGMSYLLIFDEHLDPSRISGPSAFSTSAIGHGAFVELMRESGVRVLVSRYDSLARAGEDALLIAAEPEDAEAFAALTPSTGEAGPGVTLLVLPKWRGRPDEDKPRWLAASGPVAQERVEDILHLVDPNARLVRPGALAPLTNSAFGLGAAPFLAAPQLIQSDRLAPIVAGEQGMLVGLLSGSRPTWVLSDPDIIANHGIGEGGNADFAMALVDSIRPEGGGVVIDETIHGLLQRPDLWRAMLEPPFVLATVQVLAALIVLVWAGVGRFGPPLPAERAIAPGAATLIDTGAGLLEPRRHGGHILRRYAEATRHQVEERLHAPRQLNAGQRAEWLDRVGRARRITTSYAEAKSALSAASAGNDRTGTRLTAAARLLHRWKREMLHGP